MGTSRQTATSPMTQRFLGHSERSGALAHVPPHVVGVVDPVEDAVVVAVVDAVEVAVVVAANGVQGPDPARHVCGPISELQICVTGSRQAPTESRAHTDG